MYRDLAPRKMTSFLSACRTKRVGPCGSQEHHRMREEGSWMRDTRLSEMLQACMVQTTAIPPKIRAEVLAPKHFVRRPLSKTGRCILWRTVRFDARGWVLVPSRSSPAAVM
eukprot:m.9000 g.9000  ORF g.9000 m.9000 type:complete len:111 (-) comp9341_c0_seq1:765-1097(-)